MAGLQYLALSWAASTALLLTVCPTNGLLCPLPDRDPGDVVSLCAMCSHNEAAVRWNRSMSTNIQWKNFILKYECTTPQETESSSSGDSITPQTVLASNGNGCWNLDPLTPSKHSDVSSVGLELRNGTICNFSLEYRYKDLINNNFPRYTKYVSCQSKY
jgi:hypothetical protein